MFAYKRQHRISMLWEVWSIDVEKRTGAPVPGIELNTGAFTPAVFDDRPLLMVPGADWASTQLYEVTDGEAKPLFEIPGWSYQFVKLR